MSHITNILEREIPRIVRILDEKQLVILIQGLWKRLDLLTNDKKLLQHELRAEREANALLYQELEAMTQRMQSWKKRAQSHGFKDN